MASFAGVLVMYLIAAAYILLLSKVYMQGSFSVKSILTGYVLVFLPLDLMKGVLAAWLGQRLSRSVFRQL